MKQNRLISFAKFLGIALTGVCIQSVYIASSVARAESDGDIDAVRACIRAWGDKSPFSAKDPKFKILSSSVKVLGIGSDTRDDEVTEKPELILVKPSVAVLAKNAVYLNNPQGWYCLKGRVAVLGKNEVNLHCKAKLASSKDGTVVLGASDTKGGVAVLGTSRLNRIGEGCKP